MHRSAPLTLLALGAGLAVALAWPVPAGAGVSLDVGLHVGSPPPPPVYVFEDEPEVVLIPQTRVYYVPGPSFDLFRYGRYWYINNGGWWYRAYHYRGPFVSIGYDVVPTTILRVPEKYHRHPLGGPPGQTGVHPGRGNAYGLDRGTKLDRKKWDPKPADVGLRDPRRPETRPAAPPRPEAKRSEPKRPEGKAETRPSQSKPQKKEWKR